MYSSSRFGEVPLELVSEILDYGTLEDVDVFYKAYYVTPDQKTLDGLAEKWDLPYATSIRSLIALRDDFNEYMLIDYCIRIDDLRSFIRLYPKFRTGEVPELLSDANDDNILRPDIAREFVRIEVQKGNLDDLMPVAVRHRDFNTIEALVVIGHERIYDWMLEDMNEEEFMAIAKLLVKHEKDLKEVLPEALKQGHYNVAEYLLNNGADIGIVYKLRDDTPKSIMLKLVRSPATSEILGLITPEDVDIILALYDYNPDLIIDSVYYLIPDFVAVLIREGRVTPREVYSWLRNDHALRLAYLLGDFETAAMFAKRLDYGQTPSGEEFDWLRSQGWRSISPSPYPLPPTTTKQPRNPFSDVFYTHPVAATKPSSPDRGESPVRQRNRSASPVRRSPVRSRSTSPPYRQPTTVNSWDQLSDDRVLYSQLPTTRQRSRSPRVTSERLSRIDLDESL